MASALGTLLELALDTVGLVLPLPLGTLSASGLAWALTLALALLLVTTGSDPLMIALAHR